jgi:phosphonate transport system permease protein
MIGRSADHPYQRKVPILAILALSAAGAAIATEARPASLFDRDGLESAGSLLAGLLSPDLSRAFLARIGRLALESVQIGVLATAVGVLLGFFLGSIATSLPDLRETPPSRGSRATRSAARFTLGLLRAIPDIVWAFLFVRIFGLGPVPAVLAIGLATGGAIGKMFAEIAEAVDPAPVRAMRAAGASRLGVYVHAVLPQVRRPWVSYALFRLECSLRSASILGVVGAGGLGTEIALGIQYLQFDKLATALLAVLACMALTELLGHHLRRRRALLAIGIGAAATLASFATTWPAWMRLGTSAESLRMFQSFGADANVVTTGLRLAMETIAMAWAATLLAAAVAFAGATLATRSLFGGSYLPDPIGRSPAKRAISTLARVTLQITRCVPDLALALIFVIWVGPGPFAGVLAIAVHTIGVLGRLYSDVYEDVESKAPAALEQSGAGLLGRWLHAVLPQAAPRLAAFTLYRFEINIRHTAMVGFVGAGGIGNALHTSIALFHIGDLFVLIGIMIAMVTLLDGAGDYVRRRMLAAPSKRREVTPYQVFSLARLRSLT